MGVSSLLTELLWEALGAAKEGVRQTEPGHLADYYMGLHTAAHEGVRPPGLVGSGKGED